MLFPSKTVEVAVTEISKLPGIGKKTALRLALHLLKQDENTSVSLSSSILNLKLKTTYCKRCMSISDEDICSICANKLRDASMICVVEESRDLIAIENTGQYRGLYFVLGGVISPVNGIGPSDLNFAGLLSRFPTEEVKEVIIALSATLDGDTTSFYLSKQLKNFGVKVSTIARGIPIGSELEFTDEVTLGRSILKRVSYDQT